MGGSRARNFPRAGQGRGGWARSAARPARLAERISGARPLDRFARALTTLVQRAATPAARADALHGVWLGHPVHPGLASLSAGCWTSATLADLVPGSERAAAALIAVGLAGSVPAAATGLADWSVLHRTEQRVGLAHAAASVGASGLFATSLLARAGGRSAAGRLLALAGLATLGVSSYLGRHLTFPLAAGASHAEPVAHLAPLGWHDLCRIYELPDGRLARRRLGYLTLAVLRQGPDVLAVADRCAHLGGPLHQGTLAGPAAGPCVRCPWHGSTFLLTTGAVVHGPATARQPAFQTRVVEGGVVQVRPAPTSPPARSSGTDAARR